MVMPMVFMRRAIMMMGIMKTTGNVTMVIKVLIWYEQNELGDADCNDDDNVWHCFHDADYINDDHDDNDDVKTRR